MLNETHCSIASQGFFAATQNDILERNLAFPLATGYVSGRETTKSIEWLTVSQSGDRAVDSRGGRDEIECDQSQAIAYR